MWRKKSKIYKKKKSGTCFQFPLKLRTPRKDHYIWKWEPGDAYVGSTCIHHFQTIGFNFKFGEYFRQKKKTKQNKTKHNNKKKTLWHYLAKQIKQYNVNVFPIW